MSKMKTKSGAKKRFRLTASGKVRMNAAFRRHMMINKSRKMKRQSKAPISCVMLTRKSSRPTCHITAKRSSLRHDHLIVDLEGKSHGSS